ncbi:DUF3293 domain-containing protein [Caballeronia sp. LZ062]|uniref:DUF3293 domain-containing protein n=1 Tax=unclassified Caballeronia TaxID=2646786 RepID=UPI00286614DA|nr:MULTISPECIES: DUF3293 domain-containing protein [unclassified Caballeronia]MDR5856740.1 DUF3293 domain-containing protein [Caballeronia sp. LZ050]MDR5869863.1 DUF3293 domain-containing protein [Caballeronia sp. LZ062]
MDDSSLSDATLAAYRAAVYRIYGEPPIDMMIGEKNAEIAALLARHGVSSAVFVTAFNPFGRALSAGQNGARQHMLEARIVQSGLTALPGEGIDPNGIWTAEASLLVLGATEQDADELMLAYRQNAVVVVHSDGLAQLRVHPQYR